MSSSLKSMKLVVAKLLTDVEITCESTSRDTPQVGAEVGMARHGVYSFSFRPFLFKFYNTRMSPSSRFGSGPGGTFQMLKRGFVTWTRPVSKAE
jgi:hypothetical protein